MKAPLPRPLDPEEFTAVVAARRERLIRRAMRHSRLSRAEAEQAVDTVIYATWKSQRIILAEPDGYLNDATDHEAERVVRERGRGRNPFHTGD